MELCQTESICYEWNCEKKEATHSFDTNWIVTTRKQQVPDRDLQENVPEGNHKTVCYRCTLFPSKRHKVNFLTPKVRQYRSEYSLTKWKSPGQVDLSKTNKMQRYTIFFIIINALHVSGGSPPIIRNSRTVHISSGICQACLLLPLAVAASKPGSYQMLCVQFLTSWWWAKKPPETCRALTIRKNIV